MRHSQQIQQRIVSHARVVESATAIWGSSMTQVRMDMQGAGRTLWWLGNMVSACMGQDNDTMSTVHLPRRPVTRRMNIGMPASHTWTAVRSAPGLPSLLLIAGKHPPGTRERSAAPSTVSLLRAIVDGDGGDGGRVPFGEGRKGLGGEKDQRWKRQTAALGADPV